MLFFTVLDYPYLEVEHY